MFIDEAYITVRSGSGGNGCMSFRREKFVPHGGPDGGDGGRGGNIFFEADDSLSTLLDLSRKRIYVAENGRPGRGGDRTGRRGRDVTMRLPLGTVVRQVVEEQAPQEGPLLGDLKELGQSVMVARGGRGGRGNTSFASPTNQVPRNAEEGSPGEERKLYLELKLLADVGLVGLPNAGKSTFLSVVSAATPKIAEYPFTTLAPKLGIAEVGQFKRIVVADLPGLIEGAHHGHGLGLEFLRHVERTKVLIHLVAVEADDPEEFIESFRTVEQELQLHSPILRKKPRLVAASKMDTVPLEAHESLLQELGRRLGEPVYPLSSVTGLGVQRLLRAVLPLLGEE